MISIAITTNARTATCRPHGAFVAPVSSLVLGSESAYAMNGTPIFGTQATGVVRVRDAKQAAPPRGELC